MLRAILAVIVSYILMFVLIFLAFTCVYSVIGADGSFKPGSFASKGNLPMAPSLTVGLLTLDSTNEKGRAV